MRKYVVLGGALLGVALALFSKANPEMLLFRGIPLAFHFTIIGAVVGSLTHDIATSFGKKEE
ncbi:MAG: hypothetical protein HYX21_02875 [Candidatus Yanofskybacteria bacterium]|nr:hypothetical protein [Candidatus Yanofskybacteria bacterium]